MVLPSMYRAVQVFSPDLLLNTSVLQSCSGSVPQGMQFPPPPSNSFDSSVSYCTVMSPSPHTLGGGGGASKIEAWKSEFNPRLCPLVLPVVCLAKPPDQHVLVLCLACGNLTLCLDTSRKHRDKLI